MMKHLLSATALLAVVFVASPVSAQQPRSNATSQAMIDDDYRNDHADRYSDDNHDRGNGYRHDHDSMIRCESIDNRRAYCSTHDAHKVVLVNRLSDASCVKNRSWGYNGRGIWVDRGCRADFQVRG
jgi:Ni/Co efflux regulator RcnB